MTGRLVTTPVHRGTSVRAIMARLIGPAATAAETYDDARLEAHSACRRLGLLFGKHEGDKLRLVGDLVRTAYVGGFRACETRLDSPDMADQIAFALEWPVEVLERLPGESDDRHRVRAVQQVVAFGLAKR